MSPCFVESRAQPARIAFQEGPCKYSGFFAIAAAGIIDQMHGSSLDLMLDQLEVQDQHC